MMIRRGRRRPAAMRSVGVTLGISCTLAAVGCDEDPTGPAIEQVPPCDLFIEYAGPDSVRLWWTHDGAGVTAFEVSIATVGESPDLARLPETARTYLGAGIPEERTTFSVRAIYGNQASEDAPTEMINPEILAANSFFATSLDDTISLSWNPPDFSLFDGFRLLRIRSAGENWQLHEAFEIDETSWQGIRFDDAQFPHGQSPSDRLAYVVHTRYRDVLSTPVRSENLEWSLPRAAELLVGGIREHDWGRFRFFDDLDHAIVVTETTESAKLYVLEHQVPYPFWRHVLDIEATGTRLAGTLPAESRLVMVSGLVDPGGVTIRTIALPDSQTVWETELTSGIPDVWNAPTAGAVAVIDNDATQVRIVNPEDGALVTLVPFEERAMSIAFEPVLGLLVAVAEQRDGETGTEGRLVLRNYPDGSPLWEASWRPEVPLAGRDGILFSPTGEYVAVTLEGVPIPRPADRISYLHRTGSGELVASVSGRALAFGPDDEYLIVVDDVLGRLTAYGIGGGGVTDIEDFGRSGTQGGFVLTDENILWTLHNDGWIRKWTLTRRWSRPFTAVMDLAVEEDVPRYRIWGLP